MQIQTAQGRKLPGMYRGTVLKHGKMGKCKIYVPGIFPDEYGTAATCDSLPDAEQASPLFGNTWKGNGCFSYPALNSIVWCFFENGDWNKPVYFASTLAGGTSEDMFSACINRGKDNIGLFGTILNDAEIHSIRIGNCQIDFEEGGTIEIRTWDCPNADGVYNKISDDRKKEYEEGYGDWSYINMDPSGNIILKSSNSITIESPQINVHSDDNISIKSGGSMNIDSERQTTMSSKSFFNDVKGNLRERGQPIELDAQSYDSVVVIKSPSEGVSTFY